MDRRKFLHAAALITGELCSPFAQRGLFAEAATSQIASQQAASFLLRADAKSVPISRDFMGLGYEMSSVARSGLLSANNEAYVKLVRALGSRGVIRIGGNTGDYAHYAAAAPAVSLPKGTVVNDARLKDLGGFLEKTGWQLIWALNLGNGSIENAIDEARRVREIGGAHLLAFEIGNEPDLFAHEKHRATGYSYDQWLADYRRVKAAMRLQVPGVPLAGPDVAVATDWVSRFAADEGSDLAVLTHHYYREGQNPSSSIGKLLDTDPKLAKQMEQLRQASQASKVPYRICEVNSFSGGGRPGVSDTFAAALWVLDYMFILASYGCSGVNVETGLNQLGFISSYSPIGDDEHGSYSARPEYYGMLAFALAGKGHLLSVESTGSSSLVRAYATRREDGSLGLTMINKTENDIAFEMNIDHQLLSAGRGSMQASLMQLRAPAINAKSGITLGGSEVTTTGEWAPSMTAPVQVKHGRVQLTVAAYSASIVSIGRHRSESMR